MTVKKAEAAFNRALLVPKRLLEVNQLIAWGSGFPARQQALYGAVTVMTVAAWQVLVEDLAAAARVITDRRARKAKIAGSSLAPLEINRFNTPNKQNSIALLGRGGLVLPGGWTVISHGAQLNEQQAWELVNAWLIVRHAIAHGFPFSESSDLDNLLAHPHVASRVLTARASGRGNAKVLRLPDVEGCVELFTELASVLKKAAQSYAKKK